MTEQEIATYRAALKQAKSSFELRKNRLDEISRESNRLNREMAGLRRTITALAAMCSEEPWLDSMGITEACAELMEAEISSVTTQDVVRMLENSGFDMATQKNPAASVHAVLSRLAEKGKIQKITDEKDSTVEWQGPNYDRDIPF
jgi:predicted transcriptional regulator